MCSIFESVWLLQRLTSCGIARMASHMSPGSTMRSSMTPNTGMKSGMRSSGDSASATAVASFQVITRNNVFSHLGLAP